MIPHVSGRGATLVLTAVLLIGLMAVPALVIDLGSLFTARAEAQRAADAAALAGASAWLDHAPGEAPPVAVVRAREYATANHVRNVLLTDDEVSVEVIAAERKVRVRVARAGLPTRFARFFGVDEMAVSASAAAIAAGARGARCVKPFALPDLWHDVDDDVNGNRIWDAGENWIYDPEAGDVYGRFEGETSPETGYGSGWRNATDPLGIADDFGRSVVLKYTDPQSEFVPSPGIFLPWQMPSDPDMPQCVGMGGGGGGGGGASGFRTNICSCNGTSIVLGQEYDLEPGNMVGPAWQGVQNLINQDPGATWDPSAGAGRGAVTGSRFGDDWMLSPRVVKVALFEPGQITQPGRRSIVFNNFALLFIEAQPSSKDPVMARFLYFASGNDDEGSGDEASLALVLKLVE